MTCGIYAIFDASTDECLYVGQSSTIERRWKRHIINLRNGNHPRKDFVEWFESHNKQSDSLRFETLESCEDVDETRNRIEMLWFEKLEPKFYGDEPGVNYKWKHSEETKRKIGEALKGRKMYDYICKVCKNDFSHHRLNRSYCSRACTNKRSCIEINEDLRLMMKKLYEVDRMTMKAISIELGISDATVHKLMVKFDIPRRARGSR